MTLRQGGGCACAYACGVDCHMAVPQSFAEVDKARGYLSVWGQVRPRDALDHTEGWERGLTAVADWLGFSEGNDGGVQKGD